MALANYHPFRNVVNNKSAPGVVVSGLNRLNIMIKLIKKLWLNIRLRFAKRIYSVDFGRGLDKTAWVEFRKTGGVIYITDQGFINPPTEDK